MYFSLIFVAMLSNLMLSVKNRGVGKFFLNGQNLLSMTKVIFWQSLNPKNQVLHKSKAVSSNYPFITNHRKISLTGTDHFNSKLFSLEKTVT